MKNNVQELNTSDITSEVFVISPTQIDFISQKFSNAVAEAMNMRPLAQKLYQIATETLIKALKSAKTMGEQHKTQA
jgi:hypothetical protein